MRWLFLLLLVLNVGYLAWELNREPGESTVSNTLPKGVERIVLLRELKSEKPLDEEAIAAQVASAEPAVTDAVQAPVTASSDKSGACFRTIPTTSASKVSLLRPITLMGNSQGNVSRVSSFIY